MTNINFAKQVKEEISLINFSVDQKKALLSGFVRNGCTVNILKKEIIVKTEISLVAKLIYNSFKEIYNIAPQIICYKKIHFGQGTIYSVEIQSENIFQILKELEILDDSFQNITVNKYLDDKYFESFIIGCFLSCGSINNPKSKKTSYYLEMALSNYNDSQVIIDKFNTFKEERTLSFKYIERRSRHVIYIKKSDQISVFLSFIEATQSMFDFENARILKEDINIANRLNICDMANFSRTISTSSKDIELIDKLLKVKDLQDFSLKEQAVIKTRKKYKEANYRELSLLIEKEYSLSLSKSTIARILSAIREEANKVK